MFSSLQSYCQSSAFESQAHIANIRHLEWKVGPLCVLGTLAIWGIHISPGSQTNCRPSPCEVLIQGTPWKVVRFKVVMLQVCLTTFPLTGQLSFQNGYQVCNDRGRLLWDWHQTSLGGSNPSGWSGLCGSGFGMLCSMLRLNLILFSKILTCSIARTGIGDWVLLWCCLLSRPLGWCWIRIAPQRSLTGCGLGLVRNGWCCFLPSLAWAISITRFAGFDACILPRPFVCWLRAASMLILHSFFGSTSLGIVGIVTLVPTRSFPAPLASSTFASSTFPFVFSTFPSAFSLALLLLLRCSKTELLSASKNLKLQDTSLSRAELGKCWSMGYTWNAVLFHKFGCQMQKLSKKYISWTKMKNCFAQTVTLSLQEIHQT